MINISLRLYLNIILFTLIKTTTKPLFSVNISYLEVTPNIYINLAGLSFNMSIVNITSSPLFIQLMTNPMLFQNYYNAIGLTFSSGSGVCYYDIQKPPPPSCKIYIPSSQLINFGSFLFTYTDNPFGTYGGPQFQVFNTTEFSNFQSDIQSLSYLGIYLQFGQYIDTYVQRGIRSAGYDMNSYIKEIQSYKSFRNASYLYFSGPGVNYTSTDWMSNMSLFFSAFPNDFNVFTTTMSYFNKQSDCTIENILSESYFVDIFNTAFGGYESIIQKQLVGISTLKLHPFNGINGVTNTFAATLWGLDFLVYWAKLGGTTAHFQTNWSMDNYQSPLSSLSNFTNPNTSRVNSLYYSIMFYYLFVGQIMSNQPFFSYNQMYGNLNNSNIKVYTVSDGSMINMLVINKDTNINLSGNFSVNTVQFMSEAQYFYLEANSILDINNITISGFTYDNTISGVPINTSSNNFQIYKTYPNQNGSFSIPLSYSQAVLIYFTPGSQSVSDQVWKRQDFGIYSFGLTFILIILIIGIL